jgi:hypothetical protein
MTGTCAACLHTNQSRSYLNHVVYPPFSVVKEYKMAGTWYDVETKLNLFSGGFSNCVSRLMLLNK